MPNFPNPTFPKIPLKYICETCDYKTSNKKDFAKHESTDKHKYREKPQKPNAIYLKNPRPFKLSFDCKCGKKYKHSSTLSAHKKKCTHLVKDNNIVTDIVEKKETSNEDIIEVLVKENIDFKHLMLEMMKSNTDLQKQMLEVCKNSNNSIIHNNSHNKTFNMQFFLNEQCKDAMNIMDFVDTFKMEFADLEKVGEVGYVEGMSNMIIQKLNEMDVYKRPIHCSDVKRDIIYVKDKNVWEKENSTHDRLRLFIRYVGKKNTDLLIAWCEAHPGSCDSDNILNDIYMEMVMQSMGGRGDREENENKIMRKIARSCLIDKDHTF